MIFSLLVANKEQNNDHFYFLISLTILLIKYQDTYRSCPYQKNTNPTLKGLCISKDRRVYDVNHHFSNIELDSITPQQLVRYIRLKVYGTPDPPPHANPTEGRASTLSFFRLLLYNELDNPPV